jgi:hypothetical protein
MRKDYVPRKDAELRPYAVNFNTVLAANLAQVGVTGPQQLQFAALLADYESADDLTQNALTRSPANIILRDQKRALMVANLRQLAGIIQKFPGTTDVLRSQLGLTVPKPRTQINPPTQPPVCIVRKRYGSYVQIELREAGATSRRKPAGVVGANIFVAVALTAPTDPAAYTLHGLSSRTLTTLVFDPSLPAGTMVWISANWATARGEVTAGCTPVGTTLVGGDVQLQQQSLKIAA